MIPFPVGNYFFPWLSAEISEPEKVCRYLACWEREIDMCPLSVCGSQDTVLFGIAVETREVASLFFRKLI